MTLSWQPSIALGRKRTTSTYSEYLLRKYSSVCVAADTSRESPVLGDLGCTAFPSGGSRRGRTRRARGNGGGGRNRRGPRARPSPIAPGDVSEQHLAPTARPVASPHELIARRPGRHTRRAAVSSTRITSQISPDTALSRPSLSEATVRAQPSAGANGTRGRFRGALPLARRRDRGGTPGWSAARSRCSAG